MTTADFYNNFERNIPRIQGLAKKLTPDFDTARFLYQETAHLATKHKNSLKTDNFDQWLINTMESIYFKMNFGASGKVLN